MLIVQSIYLTLRRDAFRVMLSLSDENKNYHLKNISKITAEDNRCLQVIFCHIRCCDTAFRIYHLGKFDCPDEFKAIKILWPIVPSLSQLSRNTWSYIECLIGFPVECFCSRHLLFHFPFHFCSLILLRNKCDVSQECQLCAQSLFSMVL